MTPIRPGLIALGLLLAVPHAYGEEKERDLSEYQKAIRGLRAETIHAGLTAEKMLDLCIPTSKRQLGRFTAYSFIMLPGYHGIEVIAKNDVLKCVTEWSCTYTATYFDELTADDEQQLNKMRKENEHVPAERYIGRWGWDRPRMRDWPEPGK
jgi:hypothetical protein